MDICTSYDEKPIGLRLVGSLHHARILLCDENGFCSLSVDGQQRRPRAPRWRLSYRRAAPAPGRKGSYIVRSVAGAAEAAGAKLVKVACLSLSRLSRVASSKGGRVIVRLTVCVSACDDGDG